eukprot:scaffold15327_cov58-Attheya_sp.AAC.7
MGAPEKKSCERWKSGWTKTSLPTSNESEKTWKHSPSKSHQYCVPHGTHAQDIVCFVHPSTNK